MFYLNVHLTVRDPKDAEAVADALRRTGAVSKTEDGCDRWECYRSEADPNRFLLVERWKSKEHWELHKSGEAITEIYLKEVIPLVDREPHPSTLVV